MNRLSTERRAQVVACLVEGMSIRATCRITGVARQTVNNLLLDLGRACSDYQDAALGNLDAQRVEADEIWSFVGRTTRTSRSTSSTIRSTARSGPGPRSTPTPSSWSPGSSGSARRPTTTSSWPTCATASASATASSSRPMGSARTRPGVDAPLARRNRLGADHQGLRRRQRGPQVLAAEVHGDRQGRRGGRPGRAADLDELRREAEPHDAHEHATVHASDERPLKGVRAARGGDCPALHLLQLRPPHESLGKRVTPAMAAGIELHPWPIAQICELLESN